MLVPGPTVISAPIALLSLPDLACFKSAQELIAALPQFLVAQIPIGEITNVIVSNVQPLDTQRDSIWFRKDNSGNFIGIYVYSGGTWQQMYPMPGQIFQRYRNTTDPTTDPVGYTRLDLAAGIPPTVVTALQATWVADPGNPGFYLYDQQVFTGF